MTICSLKWAGFFLEQKQQNISLKKYDQFLQGAPHKVLDLATSNPSGLQRTPCRFFEMFQVFQGPLVQSLKFIEKTSKYLDLQCCLQIFPTIKTKITYVFFQAKEKGRSFSAKNSSLSRGSISSSAFSRKTPVGSPSRRSITPPSTSSQKYPWRAVNRDQMVEVNPWVEIFINQICSEWFSNFFWAGFPTHPLFWFIKFEKKHFSEQKKQRKKSPSSRLQWNMLWAPRSSRRPHGDSGDKTPPASQERIGPNPTFQRGLKSRESVVQFQGRGGKVEAKIQRSKIWLAFLARDLNKIFQHESWFSFISWLNQEAKFAGNLIDEAIGAKPGPAWLSC